jgi:hypothetical protein
LLYYHLRHNYYYYHYISLWTVRFACSCRWTCSRRSIDNTSDMNNTTSGSYMVQLDDTANETVEGYLLRTRGPKHLSLNIVLPITVIYVFIFVTGVIGNIAVCVVIVRNNFMHTATNYYLFSLAVSDLTLLLLGKFPWI